MSVFVALDTSVAVPLLVQTHAAHAAVVRWWGGREVALSGHALAETYSVLTRLPGDIRMAPPDAARLLEDRFPPQHDASHSAHRILRRLYHRASHPPRPHATRHVIHVE